MNDHEFIVHLQAEIAAHLGTVTPPIDPPVEPPIEPPVTPPSGDYTLRSLGPPSQSTREEFLNGHAYAYEITSPHGGTSMTLAPETPGGGSVDIVISDIPGSFVMIGPNYGGIGFGLESSGASWASPTWGPVPRAVITADKKWYVNIRVNGPSTPMVRTWTPN